MHHTEEFFGQSEKVTAPTRRNRSQNKTER